MCHDSAASQITCRYLSVQVLYWLGQCKASKFLMDKADGPFRLDLGDVPYAPNTLGMTMSAT